MAETEFKLKWDQDGQRQFEMGVDRGVLYLKSGTGDKAWKGYAWNGLTNVTESPEGADKTDLWADNIKYASMRAAETFGGTIEAYTYPDQFAKCNGEIALNEGAVMFGQQKREAFGLSYRTRVGNDQDPDASYKIHLVYNCTCSPSERAYETINDSPDAITFSWEFDSNGASTSKGDKPTTCCVVIDCSKLNATKLAALEGALYGTAQEDAYLPSPDYLIDTVLA